LRSRVVSFSVRSGLEDLKARPMAETEIKIAFAVLLALLASFRRL